MENASKALIIAGAILISILLISIGIILINSGKDVTETGTAGMQRQQIETFNSQFTPYQGTIKGSQVRSLLSTVRASNVTDEAHPVVVSLPVQESQISSTKDYTATISYSDGKNVPTGMTNAVGKADKSENGYINLITIAEKK